MSVEMPLKFYSKTLLFRMYQSFEIMFLGVKTLSERNWIHLGGIGLYLK